MHLGAASMIGATASNGSDNGVSEDFDILKFTHEDLKEVSSLGYTVHKLLNVLFWSSLLNFLQKIAFYLFQYLLNICIQWHTR